MYPAPKNPALVSLEEAGRLLGVHPETLRKRAEKGEIPHLRIGDRWLIPRQWITDVANGNAAAWQPNEHGGLSRLTNWDPFTDPTKGPFFRNEQCDEGYGVVAELEPSNVPESDQ